MKKNTRLLLWLIFCLAGLILNIRAFIYYINSQNNFRIFMTALWIVIFGAACIAAILKYRKATPPANPQNRVD
jgi:hypothetical protein